MSVTDLVVSVVVGALIGTGIGTAAGYAWLWWERRRALRRPPHVHTVHLTPTFEEAVWCDEHSLPHGFKVTIHAMHGGGVSRVGEYQVCVEEGE